MNSSLLKLLCFGWALVTMNAALAQQPQTQTAPSAPLSSTPLPSNPTALTPLGDFLGATAETSPNQFLGRGDFVSIPIPASNLYGYIQKIVVVISGGGDVEVLANGRSKGVIEGNLFFRKSKVFAIDEYASSIEFRHVDGSKNHIRRIVNLQVSSTCLPYFSDRRPCTGPLPLPQLGIPSGCTPVPGGPAANQSIVALQGLVSLSQAFAYLVSPTELATSIMPVKVKATEALATGRARGTVSGEFRARILEVLQAYEASLPLIEQLQQIETNAKYAAVWIQYGEILKRAIQ